MPTLKTNITEIVTGLGTLGLDSIDSALDGPVPDQLENVNDPVWEQLRDAWENGKEQQSFLTAWANGNALLEASEGLRGRIPLRVEWKGPQSPPGYDTLPADLRIDHVFLVSCKYLSKVLVNSSPTNLFRRCLRDRSAGAVADRWYDEVAADDLLGFYVRVRRHLSALGELPEHYGDLVAADVELIREHCGGQWPQPLLQPWADFSWAVSQQSARIWSEELTSLPRQEEMLWRILRLNSAPYFILGQSAQVPLRLRIATPWDWRQNFQLLGLEIQPLPGGQPLVGWEATYLRKDDGSEGVLNGHVQVRWSHGRFSSVEAKVYLDSLHTDVPGYFHLA
jgi:hypothetical protein